MNNRRKLISALVAGALAAPFGAIAQSYPAKPIRLVVGYSTGGPTDTTARMVAQKLSEHLGQSVIVENRAGAGGRTRAVNRVPACGM